MLDTNVLVSAALTADGACARVVGMLGAGAFEVCADDRILGEYEDVLHRPELKIDAGGAAVLIEFIRGAALPVVAIPLDAALPDADDLPFLEVAASAQAILVTGNERHYPKSSCHGVTVVRPREFLELIRRSS